METLQRYSDRYAFSKFFYYYTHIGMLCHAHIRQLIRLSAALRLMAHLERTWSNYTARMVSSNSFLNWSYLILLLIFSSIHWAGVGK